LLPEVSSAEKARNNVECGYHISNDIINDNECLIKECNVSAVIKAANKSSQRPNKYYFKQLPSTKADDSICEDTPDELELHNDLPAC